MGTDIHLFVERKKSADLWEMIPPVDGFDGFVNFCKDRWPDHPTIPQWDIGRDYCEFALLAGVRNYYDMHPIAEPRGWPDIVSPEVALLKDNDAGLHDSSWLLLSELIACDLDQVVAMKGYVSLYEYARFKKTGEIQCFARGVSSEIVTNAVLDRILMENPTLMNADVEPFSLESFRAPHTLLEWTQTYRQVCPSIVRLVKALTPLGAPESIRLVFAFDS